MTPHVRFPLPRLVIRRLSKQNLVKRFPLHQVPLKKCAAGRSGAPAR